MSMEAINQVNPSPPPNTNLQPSLRMDKGEAFFDINGDGIWQAGELFIDADANGMWDNRIGGAGNKVDVTA